MDMANREKISKPRVEEVDKSLHFSDPLYAIFGVIEGAMSAVESSTLNF
jgi:hypothetical protein